MRTRVIQTQITFPVIALMAWLPDLEPIIRLSTSADKKEIWKLKLVYEI